MDEEAVQDPILSALEDTETDTSVEESTNDETETENTTDTAEVEETEGEATEPETEAEEAEESVELDPKDEARRRYEERQAFKQEQRQRIETQNKDYVDEAENDIDQRVRAMEVQRYQEIVENTQEKLVNEFERAKADPSLQIFNRESQEFNQKLYDKVIRDYNAGYINYDTNGNMIGVKGSLFQHLTETAELFQGAVKSGAIQQVRAGRQMKATADIKPAASPKETAKDPILDILKSD